MPPSLTFQDDEEDCEDVFEVKKSKASRQLTKYVQSEHIRKAKSLEANGGATKLEDSTIFRRRVIKHTSHRRLAGSSDLRVKPLVLEDQESGDEVKLLISRSPLLLSQSRTTQKEGEYVEPPPKPVPKPEANAGSRDRDVDRLLWKNSHHESNVVISSDEEEGGDSAKMAQNARSQRVRARAREAGVFIPVTSPNEQSTGSARSNWCNIPAIEESDEDVNKWEMEQIRKGSGRQNLATTSRVTEARADVRSKPAKESQLKARGLLDQSIKVIPEPERGPRPAVQILSRSAALAELQSTLVQAEEQVEKLASHKKEEEDRHKSASDEKKEIIDRLNKSDGDLRKAEEKQKTLADLLEFLCEANEMASVKMHPIEKAMDTLWKIENAYVCCKKERMLQDLTDEIEEATAVPKEPQLRKKDEFGRNIVGDEPRRRRVANRQSRRQAQTIARQSRPTTALYNDYPKTVEDGYDTTDDSEPERDEQFQEEKNEFYVAARGILDDVEESYFDTNTYLERFQTLRIGYAPVYERCRCAGALVQLLRILCQWHLLFWNPLRHGLRSPSSAHFEKKTEELWLDAEASQNISHTLSLEDFQWYHNVANFIRATEEKVMEKNPDADLDDIDIMVTLVSGTVFDFVEKAIQNWDPFSRSESKRLKLLLEETLLFKAEGPNAKLSDLLSSLVRKMESNAGTYLASDKIASANRTVTTRLLWRAVKATKCCLEFTNVLSGISLRHIVFDVILQKHINPFIDSKISSHAQAIKLLIESYPNDLINKPCLPIGLKLSLSNLRSLFNSKTDGYIVQRIRLWQASEQ